MGKRLGLKISGRFWKVVTNRRCSLLEVRLYNAQIGLVCAIYNITKKKVKI